MARTTSDYPTSIDAFVHATTDFNAGDAVPSSDFERMLDAIKNIETKLGITGGAADLDSAVVINESGADKDFRVEGNTSTNLLLCDAGNDNVSINAVAVSAHYDLGLLGDGVLCLKETSTPTADANYGKIYTKNTNKMFFQDGAGTEHELFAGTAAECTQLGNIDTTTISTTQWGYLGAATQGIWVTTAKARVNLGNAQTALTNNTWLRVDLDNEVYDPGSNFNNGLLGSGTADGTTANHLIDSGYDFAAAGIVAGMRIKNTTDTTYTYITAVAVGDLTLRDDVFVDGEGWEVQAARFVAPIDGYYQINAAFAYSLNVVTDKNYLGAVYVNGALVVHTRMHSSFADWVVPFVSDVIHLDADDYVELYAKQVSGVDTVELAASYTFLSIHFQSN